MACAGRTARNFATSCTTAEGGVGFDAVDPSGVTLYYGAGDAATLQAGLSRIAAGLCCDCIL